MIIDFHTHTFPTDVRLNREKYLQKEEWFGQLYSSPRAKMASPEDLLASMDAAGVDKAVLCGFCWSKHDSCVMHNDFTMDAVRRYPERFIGFASIQPREGRRAVSELERCMAGGMKGIGEWNPNAQRFSLDEHDMLAPVVEAAVNYRIPVIVHTTEPLGHEYRGKHGAELASVYHFVKRFPDFYVVCAHWGGGLPFYELMPEVAGASQNMYYDTAASPLLYLPSIFRVVPQVVGHRRILFGSDFPLISHASFLEDIRKLHLPRETREAILGKNAAALLRLDTSTEVS
ncbi:MAG: amidohydrolase [Chloroflexi bacterium]|nr:amidohydrolase [Chloroflexota bacterium]